MAKATPRQRHKEPEGEAVSPGKTLAGVASVAPARTLQGDLPDANGARHP